MNKVKQFKTLRNAKKYLRQHNIILFIDIETKQDEKQALNQANRLVFKIETERKAA